MAAPQISQIFESVLADDILAPIVTECGLQIRQRKLEALSLVRAMVVSAATSYGGRQADVMRLYFENGAAKVTRAAFYSWFSPKLEAVMARVSRTALERANETTFQLPGFLGRGDVKDWLIVDSTTIPLDDELKEEYPGTGGYAALKIHKTFSVGRTSLVAYKLSPARDHDSIHLTVDEAWRGYGLLADLGYASFDLIRKCGEHDVTFVIRLKDNWKPRVVRFARGEVLREISFGETLGDLIACNALSLDGSLVDAEVELGKGNRTIACRVVGVPTPEGKYRFYLTNLPRSTGPNQIADLYRVRWEIECDNKVNKSCFQIDEIEARSGPALRAMIHAAMASSILASLAAFHVTESESKPSFEGEERTKPPVHTQALARAMGCAALSIARTFELDVTARKLEWERISGYLADMGRDPNWRRSPSILDQLRGWSISPGRPRKARTASTVKK
jgi:hypothetical protein